MKKEDKQQRNNPKNKGKDIGKEIETFKRNADKVIEKLDRLFCL